MVHEKRVGLEFIKILVFIRKMKNHSSLRNSRTAVSKCVKAFTNKREKMLAAQPEVDFSDFFKNIFTIVSLIGECYNLSKRKIL